jgi:hypothetical protein
MIYLEKKIVLLVFCTFVFRLLLNVIIFSKELINLYPDYAGK